MRAQRVALAVLIGLVGAGTVLSFGPTSDPVAVGPGPGAEPVPAAPTWVITKEQAAKGLGQMASTDAAPARAFSEEERLRSELGRISAMWDDVEFQDVNCESSPCVGVLAGPDPTSPLGNDAYERVLDELRAGSEEVYGSQQRGVGQNSLLLFARTPTRLSQPDSDELYERMRTAAAHIRQEMGE